jgi:hypothetical protein
MLRVKFQSLKKYQSLFFESTLDTLLWLYPVRDVSDPRTTRSQCAIGPERPNSVIKHYSPDSSQRDKPILYYRVKHKENKTGFVASETYVQDESERFILWSEGEPREQDIYFIERQENELFSLVTVSVVDDNKTETVIKFKFPWPSYVRSMRRTSHWPSFHTAVAL